MRAYDFLADFLWRSVPRKLRRPVGGLDDPNRLLRGTESAGLENPGRSFKLGWLASMVWSDSSVRWRQRRFFFSITHSKTSTGRGPDGDELGWLWAATWAGQPVPGQNFIRVRRSPGSGFRRRTTINRVLLYVGAATAAAVSRRTAGDDPLRLGGRTTRDGQFAWAGSFGGHLGGRSCFGRSGATGVRGGSPPFVEVRGSEARSR